MADFTWLTHSLWMYEVDRKKNAERRLEEGRVGSGTSSGSTTTTKQATPERRIKRSEGSSKN